MAENLCDTRLAGDFLLDCNNMPTAGLEDEALLINRSDIDFALSKFSETQKNVLSEIILKTGARAYSVQQAKDSFNGTNWESTEGTYLNGTTHTFAAAIFDNSAKGKEQVEKLLNGKFVAIIENKVAPDDGKFEVLGWNTGLQVPTISKDYVSQDANGVTTVSLASAVEPESPYVFFDEDYATTKAMFDALKTAV